MAPTVAEPRLRRSEEHDSAEHPIAPTLPLVEPLEPVAPPQPPNLARHDSRPLRAEPDDLGRVEGAIEVLDVRGMQLPVFVMQAPASGILLQWDVVADAGRIELRELLRRIISAEPLVRGAFVDWDGPSLVLQCVVDREVADERRAAYRAEREFRQLFPSIPTHVRLLDVSDVVGDAVPGARRINLR